jgi:predicted nuclease of predicted toxin-antitoxin system
MRFLIDEDVDVRVIRVLKQLGHDAHRVPSGTTNGAVIRLAKQEERILITRDSDFVNPAIYPLQKHSGIVHISIHPPSIEKIGLALTRLLESASESDLTGKVLILEETGRRPATP